MRVELHPDAQTEFAAQVEYYDDQQSGMGERFYREVIRQVARFVQIAVIAGQTKIVFSIRSAVLFGANVLDVEKRERSVFLRKAAILATVVRSASNSGSHH